MAQQRKKLLNVYFAVRHGESTANVAGIITSTLNSAEGHGLTPKGIQQAEKAANQLRARLGPDAKDVFIITSDFERAQQTAAVIAEQLGAAKPTEDARLRERFFGDFEGASNTNYETVWNKDKKSATHTEDGVESVASVAQRVTALVADVEARCKHRNVVFVSHGDTLGILIAASMGSDLRHHRRVALDNAEVREFSLQLADQNQRLPPQAIRAGPMPFIGKLLAWFSTNGTRAGHRRLVSIGISHYCEKVRWALDLAGCPYTEDMHPPGLHMFATIPVTGAHASMTPVIVTDDGVAMWESTQIIEDLARSYPDRFPAHFCTPEAHGWEEYFDQSLGPNARRVVYSHLLPRRDICVPIMTRNVSWIERTLFPKLFDRVATGMYRSLVVDEDAVAASLSEIRKVFDRVSRHLAGGRAYLCGDTFSSADLTFAALSYPLLLPSLVTNAVLGLDLFDMPQPLQQLVAELRATPAGQHALRVYEKHRPREGETLRLHVESRDRVPPLLPALVVLMFAVSIASGAWFLRR
eukprot:m.11856 g.11856  ORF g.11856 m.11856 type:complete len:525 (+) comp5888_c0_seq1:23-1597(+)